MVLDRIYLRTRACASGDRFIFADGPRMLLRRIDMLVKLAHFGTGLVVGSFTAYAMLMVVIALMGWF